MTTGCRPSIDRQRRGISVDGRNAPHIVIFATSPEEHKHYTRSTPKDADGRVDRLGQRRRLGLVFTDMAALHHTKPLT
ncbi:hypothetical protein [Mesorhizobium sp. M0977]|uniref:hypothetical protein n=1 Tax=Mesorhizobium sp. M0977 TaxID=2957039 RepID=UPI00333B8E54